MANELFTLKELRDMIPTYDGDEAVLNDFIEACNFVDTHISEEELNAKKSTHVE